MGSKRRRKQRQRQRQSHYGKPVVLNGSSHKVGNKQTGNTKGKKKYTRKSSPEQIFEISDRVFGGRYYLVGS